MRFKGVVSESRGYHKHDKYKNKGTKKSLLCYRMVTAK